MKGERANQRTAPCATRRGMSGDRIPKLRLSRTVAAVRIGGRWVSILGRDIQRTAAFPRSRLVVVRHNGEQSIAEQRICRRCIDRLGKTCYNTAKGGKP